jgi:transcriptional regulator with XRE-family HTH domain
MEHKTKKNTHPIDVLVGEAIRTRRRMLGLTQADVAEPVGIKFQQLQKYETGYNRVSASRLWGIAKVLRVPVSYFFKECDKPEADRVKLTQEQKILFGKMETLTPKQVSVLTDTVDLFLE